MTEVLFSKPEILFDVDGVLVYPQLQFKGYLERHHGISAEMTESFFHGRFKACVIGKAELADELDIYLHQWGWRGTVSSFIETWMREDSTPDHGMLEVVSNLRSRGFKCHVASVQERTRAAYLRQTIGFEQAFDETFFSCDVGAAKPDPAFYNKIQERLARAPHDLLLVDDSRACIEAAHGAGWQAFQYTGPNDRARLVATIPGFNTF